ncbi:hypothetical protein ABW16_14040 [Mycolicibacter heraklionensis]|uniref:DUF3558 domain-containing protein n=1 Tax=Mycolicibacter heraklionensis TaxID=512402 RepID=A0ABR5FDY1_9MYCO|nr:hypothetical protein [Mycolicibacter heraklionensis]KLO28062.1 hypothetical protein ABW16_14040 [Mycolicibacter heraklionensis]
MQQQRNVLAVLFTVVLVSLASACGSSGTGQSPAAASGSAQSAKRIDACSMISPQDISSLLGVSVAGVSTGTEPDMGDCTWTNPSNDESVSLTIGNAGTALNNTLPAPDANFPDPTTPGPDGMRYMSSGSVEFAAGNRTNTVQVAVLRLLGDQANAAAVDLARKVAPQVPR